MRRFSLLWLFMILVAIVLCGCKRTKLPFLFKKSGLPVIETPALFTGTIQRKDCVVFVEYSDSLSVKGHCMLLDEAMSDTIPFQLDVQGNKARLSYNKESHVFCLRYQSIDHRHFDGNARLSFFKKAGFSFQMLDTPSFHSLDNGRYRDTLYRVEEVCGVPYAKVRGYWSEMGDETAVTAKILQLGQAVNERDLELNLDVFLPLEDTLQKRPLVMLIHGGAFYYGSKDDVSITRWCRHLASMGYVASSIDYRIGFIPSMAGISRAGYRAVQDAHAAMRYLVSHQEEYGIDTSMIFVGGTSAGAITALNLAFMTNETRPVYSHSGFLRTDLGDIDTCGNDIVADFRIKGIVDMWGAMADTSCLRDHDIPILAFHGDADDIVPYGYDYPFRSAGAIKNLLVEKMYGSSCIVDRSIKLGHKAHLVTFSHYKHSPHVKPGTKHLNDNFYLIQDTMANFFYDIIVPEKLEILEQSGDYSVSPEPLATSWQVEGGVILSSGDHGVKVAWIRNAPQRSITVSAAMPYGVGCDVTKDIP